MAEIKVQVHLTDIWEEIADDQFADELEVRWNEAEIREAVRELSGGVDEIDQMFGEWSEWDRAELLKAVREDDGRRAIDLLRRHAA